MIAAHGVIYSYEVFLPTHFWPIMNWNHTHHCWPELALGQPRIWIRQCVCVCVCLGLLRAHYTPLQRYMSVLTRIEHGHKYLTLSGCA